MMLLLENGRQIRGDQIRSSVLRSDLSPVPSTLEASIRLDDSYARFLTEGRQIIVGDDAYDIVFANPVDAQVVQGDRKISETKIIALLSACAGVSYVRGPGRAIIKEQATLAGIYRSAGALVSGIDADFPVPRFYCPVGDTPSFQIARVLQEEGGVVRWKSGRLRFHRLADLFKQKPVMTLPEVGADNVQSGFLERHQVPWFYSLAPSGAAIFGTRDKARSVLFSPHKNVQRLRNMTTCLVSRKVTKMAFYGGLCAGDIIDFAGGVPLCVQTAVHYWGSDGQGEAQQLYTRAWLSGLET